MSRIILPITHGRLAVVLSAPLVVGLPQPQSAAALHSETATSVTTTSRPSLPSLPLTTQASISAVLGRDSASYHAVARGNGFHAKNPDHELTADFTPQGVALGAGKARWVMALTGVGYGEALRWVDGVAPQSSANRVEYRRGLVTEWYVNGPLGLEQGFTLEAPPGPRSEGEPLTLALELSGPWQPRLDADRAGVTFRQADGSSVLRYGSLSGYDSAGRELAVWLDVRQGTQLRLHVDDTGARYLLVVDPLVQTETGRAKLTASDGVAQDALGVAVAVSGDTIVVGAYLHDIGGNIDQGSAYVFVQPAGGWSGRLTEAAKLTVSDGGASVFVEPAGGWGGSLTETAELTASDGAKDDLFGYFVAISGDTAVVGAFSHDIGRNIDQGAAYVFVEPGGGWGGNLSESATLTASDGALADWFGHSVAISGDTVVVGARLDDVGGNINQGSTYVFVEPGGGWGGNLNEKLKLTAPDGAAADEFGVSVAFGGDAIVVGAYLDDVGANTDQGSAYVFARRHE